MPYLRKGARLSGGRPVGYRVWRIVVFGLCIAFAMRVHAETPAAPDTALPLDQAVAAALARNPGLAEIGARANAMAAIPPQAGALPDPVLSMNALNLPTDTFATDQEPMTQLQVGIEQSLPFPGKRDLKVRAAQRDASAAAHAVDEARLRLVHQVRRLWWQIFYLDRSLDIVERNQALLRQFVQIAQTKYKVGEGLQQEVLLAQVELSKLFDRQIELSGLRAAERARLNALLDRPATTPLRLPEKVRTTLTEAPAEEVLYARAEQSRPLLARRREEAAASRARRDLARRDRYPDFRLGAAYGFRQGENTDGSSRPDFASVRLGVTLPLYAGRKQSKALDQRSSELLEKRFALKDSYGAVQAEISAALANYRSASERVRLFESGVIPQARQSVASMLSGYQVGKVDFLNLVQAQVTLYNYETQYWKSFSEARQAQARLVAAVGEEVIHD